MSKLTKTVGKWKLWTVVSAIIVAAGIIVAAIFGFNADYTASDVKTMTVKLDSYVSVSDVKTEKVKDICESALEKAGLKDAYTMDGETSGGGELVYVFSAKTDDKKLAEVKTAVESALETATADSGELAGAILYVTANSERAAATLAAGYLWRAALAGAVVLLAEFIYIAVRYKLNMGAAAAISSLTGTLLTVALVALVRLPVTASLAYAGAFALLYTTVTSMLALNKMRENFKTDEYKEKFRRRGDCFLSPRQDDFGFCRRQRGCAGAGGRHRRGFREMVCDSGSDRRPCGNVCLPYLYACDLSAPEEAFG